jgi:hypothetical protein
MGKGILWRWIWCTCAVTSSSFAHDDVASLVVDDYADADEGALGLRHDARDVLFVKSDELLHVKVK